MSRKPAPGCMSSMLAATNPGTATHASSTPASPSLGLGLDTQQLVSLVRACQVISPGAAASLGRSAAATAAATLRRVHARLAYDAAAVVCGLRPCFMADYAPLLPLRALMDVTTNIAALTRASRK